MDIEEKRALRKNGLFTEAQLMKYRKWFDAMDADKSGSVNVEELTSVLLSSGIMKYKYEVENMFRAADADRSGEISFEEFVSGIGSTIAAGKLQLHRLDALVDETNVLSAETMLSQARREILMEHIIHQTTQRNAEIDKIANRLDSENMTRGTRRRQETICAITKSELKSHRSLDSLVGQHQLRRLKSMQTISNLSQILSAEISKKPSADYSFSPPSSSSSKPLHGNSSGHTMRHQQHGQQQGPGQDHSFLGKDLVPLESILHPSLWDLIDPTLRTFPDQRDPTPHSFQALPPLATTPRLCSAAFQTASDSLSFPPRSKISLRRIGSHEFIKDSPRDSVNSGDEDEMSSQASSSASASINFTKPLSSTISLHSISKKNLRPSNFSVRRRGRTKDSAGGGGRGDASPQSQPPSQFFLSVQNRHSLKRSELFL